MSHQVLGKRSRPSVSSPSRSSAPGPKSRRISRASVALQTPSPDPTPNPKRVKAYSTETVEDDGSNKENIPPEGLLPVSPNASDDASNSSSDSPVSTSMMTPRAMRAFRRASTESTRSPTSSSRLSAVSSSRLGSTSSSSRVSASPPVSRKATQLRAGTETPSKTMARLSLSTPPQTPGHMPLRTSTSTEDTLATNSVPFHKLARAVLRPQAHDTAPLVGREQERALILEFLSPFLKGHSQMDDATSLYVSGAPGTGKTALINEVLKSVSSSATSDAMDVDDVSVRVVYVNCMGLGAKGGMHGVWERCVEEIGAEKKKHTDAKMGWGGRFGNLLRHQKCILVLDEIDHLAASASISTSQIFALASAPACAFLRIIGISNTHTLIHAQPSAYTQTIHFEPYTAGQMKAVLSARLASLPSETSNTKLFPAPTLALLTLKIASQTGDIRTVFSVARRALDIAVTTTTPCSTISVTPAHVLAALKASNASAGASQGKSGAETVTRVQNLGLHARFALTALLLATKRVVTGLPLTGSASPSSTGKLKENAQLASTPGRDTIAPVIDITALHGFYAAILSRGAETAFRGVGRTEFGDLVGLLEGSGLVELSLGRGFGNKTKNTKGKGTQVVCVAKGVREAELVRGLVGSVADLRAEETAVNVREEEVKHVWERETGRMAREIKARFGEAAAMKAEFEGAEED